MHTLPTKLYSVASVRKIEQLAIQKLQSQQCESPSYELMKRAGEATLNVIKSHYPSLKNLLIICGAGNNAGDGYVVATLAKQYGYFVRVVSLAPTQNLKNEALLAYQDWSKNAENSETDLSLLNGADIIVDAILGTGLSRSINNEWMTWIDAINALGKPIVSVDIPSGLHADTGSIDNVAIQADITVSFVGLKQGLFTSQAKDVCGKIIFYNLSIAEEVYQQVPHNARLIESINYSLLPERASASHKGHYGHVLLVGGNDGMPGAIILAATAALRAGAGLLTIITIEKNLQAISSAVPEAMVKTCAIPDITNVFNKPFVDKITHIAIGMGLAQDEWASSVLQQCVKLQKPMIVDADALNIIAKQKITITAELVITPHPGEASRLLNISSADVQTNRFAAVKSLHDKFNKAQSCVVVLKGAGTLIYNGRHLLVCDLGNAAMASPGMGDVLSGIVVALMAQKIPIESAVELAVCLHSKAADNVAQGKTRGLLASDVVNALPTVLQ